MTYTEYELALHMSKSLMRTYTERYMGAGFVWDEQNDLEAQALWNEYIWYVDKTLGYWRVDNEGRN